MPPTDPISLKVINRTVSILNAIEAGDNYFYKPYKVSTGFISYEKAKDGNLYTVYRGEPGPIEFAGTDLYNEIFFLIIQATIHDISKRAERIEKTKADIRRAINVDSKSSDPDTLGTLTDEMVPTESIDIFYYDEYFDDADGFVRFEQKYRVLIHGDFGEL